MDSDVGVDAALDEAVLDGLAASLGDGEEGWQFVTELVDVFLVDGDGHVKELRQAVERGDAETARRIFRLIDALEDSDDVQNVFSNFDLSADVQAELEEDE